MVICLEQKSCCEIICKIQEKINFKQIIYENLVNIPNILDKIQKIDVEIINLLLIIKFFILS